MIDTLSDFQRFKNNLAALEIIATKKQNELSYSELSSLFSGFGNFPYFTMPLADIISEKFDTKSTKRYYDEIRVLINKLNNTGLNNDNLKSLFQKIARSALYAYYTDANYVNAIVKNIFDSNIEKINESNSDNPFMILEPSAGTGVFVKSLIDEIRDRKLKGEISNDSFFRIFAIEPEVISYRILNALKNEITNDDNIVFSAHNNKFENFQILDDRQFNLVISNIPFGSTKIVDELIQKEYHLKKHPNIHNYFFLKSSLLLKNNGQIGYITSSNFFDSPRNFQERKVLLENNITLENLVRLPKETFKGTEVQTDYVLLNKKQNLTDFEIKTNNQLAYSIELKAEELFIDPSKNPNKDKSKNYNINSFVFLNKENIVVGDYESNFMHNSYVLSSSLKNEHDRIEKFKSLLNKSIYSLPEDTFISESILRTPQDTPEYRKFFLTNHIGNIPSLEIKKSKNTSSQNLSPSLEGIQLSLFDFEIENNDVTASNNKIIDTVINLPTQDNSIQEVEKLYFKELQENNIYHYSGAYVAFNDNIFILENMQLDYYEVVRLNNPAKQDIELMQLKNSYLWFQEARKQKNSNIVEQHQSFIKEYNKFTEQYGSINSSLSLFKGDQFALEFAGLEIRNDEGIFKASDLLSNEFYFVENTSKISTPEQALVKSLQKHNGKVKIQYICELLNISDENKKIEIAKDLVNSEKIFNDYKVVNNTVRYKFSTFEDFVSGNIPEKLAVLEQLIENEKSFEYMSIDKMKQDLSLLRQHDIRITEFTDLTININAEWLDKKYLERFLQNKFEFDSEQFFEFTKLNGFMITSKGFKNCYGLTSLNVPAASRTISGGEILKDIINDKSFNFTTKIIQGEREFYVKDIKANKDAEMKAKLLKKDWKAFLNGLDIREQNDILNQYNHTFCSNVPKKYNGSYLDFSDVFGIDDAHQHQKDVVSMILQNDGGIVDHKVGAGKSLVMFSAVMKMKQSGLKQKPMLAVTRATAEQIHKEFKFHYPDAKLFFDTSELDGDNNLSSEEKRKKKYSLIANNDWDCVIMTHEEIAKIPIPLEIQIEYTQEHLDDLRDNVYYKQMLKSEGVNVGDLKQLEKKLESEETKLESMFDKLNANKDSTIYDFNSLGVDHLLIDEAHKFKNMPFTTIHSGVAGLSTQSSERAKHYAMITRSLRRKYNLKDKGVTVLSGTFISNSMAEIYNLMNWIMPSRLQELQINTFDRFAKNFFVKESQQELSVGNAIKEKERFRYIVNVPELKSLYLEFAHVVNDSNFTIKTPNVKTEMVIVDANIQQEKFNDLLVDFIDGNNETVDEFESIIQKSFDDKQKQASSLIVSNLSQKNGIDPRLINDDYFVEPLNGKLHTCAKNIAEMYDKTHDLQGVQLVFSDLGVPSSKNKEVFNVYDGLRDILVNKYNIPRNEIQFAHDWRAASGTKKDKALRKEFQEKLNTGVFRIGIGSTETLGTGVNVQTKCIASHDLDIPWTPSKTEQRIGRMKRQGNEIAENFDNTVFNYKYLAKKSLDAFRSQANETKEKFLNVFKKIGVDTPRILDEGELDGDGNGTNYSLMKAYILDNPQMLEIAKLEQKLENLYNNKEAIENETIRINRSFNYYTEILGKEQNQLELYINTLEHFNTVFSNVNPETFDNYPEIDLYKENERISGIQDFKIIGKELRLRNERILQILQNNNYKAVESFRKVIDGEANYIIPLMSIKGFHLNVRISDISFNDLAKSTMRILIQNDYTDLVMMKRSNTISKETTDASTIIFNEIHNRLPKLIDSTQESIISSKEKIQYFSSLKENYKPFEGNEEIENISKKIIDLKQNIEIEKKSKKMNNKQSL